jgi:hypothetical protein
MVMSRKFFQVWRNTLMCAAVFGLSAGIVTGAVAKDEPVKPEAVVKQSGNILVKFKANVSDAKIQEVSDYYGAHQVMPLTSAESSTHKLAEQWRKLKFESVDDLKDIARRILQDNRVDEVE